ncbi:hypothetical protein Q7F17_15045 [Escherichia coli]|uniref:hypothetical protein n=1 Tax=Enterobacteriaceae TaxID=543 RepID=UPI001660ED37|nr:MULTISPECIES: hypothetical protein [Enterobacteriaceae]MBD0791128.1 hypothetical protein [Klebsiella sp. K5]MDD1952878.1 hypothetical protein [Klebsiella variicola]MDO8867176.1 hypothetical protein [Escherichia coli]HBQ4498564.1 hypothetical protein [Escherichia coli]HDP4751822.1 hypothetical protein [Escherichia coli]
MALNGEFHILTSNGDTVFRFAKIQSFGGNAASINLSVFFSDTDDDEMAPGAMKNYTFTPDPDSSESITDQGYTYLKTLPLFSGASNI